MCFCLSLLQPLDSLSICSSGRYWLHYNAESLEYIYVLRRKPWVILHPNSLLGDTKDITQIFIMEPECAWNTIDKSVFGIYVAVIPSYFKLSTKPNLHFGKYARLTICIFVYSVVYLFGYKITHNSQTLLHMFILSFIAQNTQRPYQLIHRRA